MQNARPEIVLNRMFAGEFLDDHIGHEIVNMYKDDLGRNYVYIQPYGTYQSSHHCKIGAVLMVRGIPGKSALEVLGLATELTDFFDPSLDYKKQWEVHAKYIRDMRISYGGMPLLNIFDRSKEKEKEQPVYFTMEAKRVMRPNRKVYLIYGEKQTIDEEGAKIILLPHTKQAKCSLKQYFDSKSDDYGALKALVDCTNLWTEDTYPLAGDGRPTEIHEDNFFDICGVADYELAFSNALSYYINKYPELVIEFAKQYFGKNIKEFRVLREWKNIDLLLENNEQIVVIENKITSKINGIQVKEGKLVGTQLKKYYEIAQKKAQGEFLDNDDFMRIELQKHPKATAFFILTPDYNPINLDEYNTDGFTCKEHYKQLFYSEIFSFLKDRHPNDFYFQEFLKGMKKHTSRYHTDLFEETRTKFIKQIQQTPKTK